MNRFVALFVAGLLAATGCNDVKPSAGPSAGTTAAAGESDVTANLAKLSTEDRALADAQKLCPVSDEPLGSMEVPIKLTLNDKSVFICCKGCKKGAEKDADKTLQKVAELKAKKSTEK